MKLRTFQMVLDIKVVGVKGTLTMLRYLLRLWAAIQKAKCKLLKREPIHLQLTMEMNPADKAIDPPKADTDIPEPIEPGLDMVKDDAEPEDYSKIRATWMRTKMAIIQSHSQCCRNAGAQCDGCLACCG